MMMYPTAFDWAYLAGMVDGEGTIRSFQKRGGHLLIELAVSNTNRGIIDWIQARFGGHARPRGRRNPLHSIEYVWNARGDEADSLLKKLQPHLKIKREQAWLAQEAWAQRYDGGKRRWRVSDELLALRRGFHLASLYLNRRGKGVA